LQKFLIDSSNNDAKNSGCVAKKTLGQSSALSNAHQYNPIFEIVQGNLGRRKTVSIYTLPPL
jgi:hypothetical protein